MKCKQRIFGLLDRMTAYQALGWMYATGCPQRIPGLERAIAKNPQQAYAYARVIKWYGKGNKERIPVIEHGIAQDGEWAMRYADRILCARFPEGEPAIFRSQARKQQYENIIHEQEQRARYKATDVWPSTTNGLMAGEPLCSRSESAYATIRACFGD